MTERLKPGTRWKRQRSQPGDCYVDIASPGAGAVMVRMDELTYAGRTAAKHKADQIVDALNSIAKMRQDIALAHVRESELAERLRRIATTSTDAQSRLDAMAGLPARIGA